MQQLYLDSILECFQQQNSSNFRISSPTLTAKAPPLTWGVNNVGNFRLSSLLWYTVRVHCTPTPNITFGPVTQYFIFLYFRSFWYHDFCTTCNTYNTANFHDLVSILTNSFQSKMWTTYCITTIHNTKVYYYNTSFQSVLQQCRRFYRFSCHSWPTVLRALLCCPISSTHETIIELFPTPPP